MLMEFLRLIVLLGDAAILFLADFTAFFIRFGEHYYLTRNFQAYQKIVLLILAFKLICLYLFQLYSNVRFRSYFIVFINVVKAMTFSALIMGLFAYFLRADAIPRLVIVCSWFLSILFLCSWHSFYKGVLAYFWGSEYFKARLLMIGTDARAQEIAIRMLHTASLNYKIIGFVKENSSVDVKSLCGFPVLGDIDDIKLIAANNTIDQIVITVPHLSLEQMTDIFSLLKGNKKVSFLTTSESLGMSMEYMSLKKILDVLFASLLLMFLFLPMCVIALLVKMTSPGPVFYFTKRIGFMGSEFIMFKFRTMYQNGTVDGPEIWAQKEDQRVTPFGRFLRRYRLDELPQLVNVIRGQMSLIGPRPETKYYTDILINKINFYCDRLTVKPGISGWAQVNQGYVGNIEESRQKLLLDIYYIQNISISFDLIIVLKTIKTIMGGNGR